MRRLAVLAACASPANLELRPEAPLTVPLLALHGTADRLTAAITAGVALYGAD